MIFTTPDGTILYIRLQDLEAWESQSAREAILRFKDGSIQLVTSGDTTLGDLLRKRFVVGVNI